jgi:hypothetical protein
VAHTKGAPHAAACRPWGVLQCSSQWNRLRRPFSPRNPAGSPTSACHRLVFA